MMPQGALDQLPYVYVYVYVDVYLYAYAYAYTYTNTHTYTCKCHYTFTSTHEYRTLTYIHVCEPVCKSTVHAIKLLTLIGTENVKHRSKRNPENAGRLPG